MNNTSAICAKKIAVVRMGTKILKSRSPPIRKGLKTDTKHLKQALITGTHQDRVKYQHKLSARGNTITKNT